MNAQRSDRRAFTLLELLVSSTILVSAITLMSAVWAQAARWQAETTGHESALVVSSVGVAMQEQWATRRAHVRLDDQEGPSQRLEADRFEFVTATPMLHPGAGLVRAMFFIEDGSDAGKAIRYQEQRVTEATTSHAIGEDALVPEAIRETVLVEECSVLQWECFVELLDEDALETLFLGWVSSREFDSLEHDASQVRTLAYRLRGQREGRAFEWVLDVAALR